MTMRLMLFILVVCLGNAAIAETVYKTVDENGNVIFTDKPSDDAEEVKIQELQTIDNPNPAKYRPPSKPNKKDVSANVYNTLLVTNPADGSGLRNNAGNVSISVSLEPGLRQGHKIIISMDGKELSNGSSTSASQSNVDRGEHTISVKVVDQSGKTLKSASSRFALLRASR